MAFYFQSTCSSICDFQSVQVLKRVMAWIWRLLLLIGMEASYVGKAWIRTWWALVLISDVSFCQVFSPRTAKKRRRLVVQCNLTLRKTEYNKTFQANVASDVIVEDDGGVFDLVWDAAGVRIQRIGGDLVQSRDKGIGNINDSISIFSANGFFK